MFLRRYFPHLITLVLLAVSVYILLWIDQNTPSHGGVTEGFEGNFSQLRGKISEIKQYPETMDPVYTRLAELVSNEPQVFKYDIEKLKSVTDVNENSTILDAGCGPGRHLEQIIKLCPGTMVEGVDRSKNMVKRAMIRNPGAEVTTASLTGPGLYKPSSLTHIFALHETLNHNTPAEINKILSNFYNWLKPGGYLAVHLLDPKNLDPGPREFSQYFKAPDGSRHSLTYFEAFTHEAWWEKEKGRPNMYRYCEKFTFPNKKVKIKTHQLWIPARQDMASLIMNNGFRLREIIDMDGVEAPDFSLYVFRRQDGFKKEGFKAPIKPGTLSTKKTKIDLPTPAKA